MDPSTNEPPSRSWEKLAHEARDARPPDIDVLSGVLASLPRRHLRPANPLLEDCRHWSVRLAIACSVTLAAAATYAGVVASEQLLMLSGFSF